MSLEIIRADLLKFKCEAIVNPTDCFKSGSGSIDKRIHKLCGKELDELFSNINDLEVSKPIITTSFNLKNCDYIIHIVGPKYLDGKHHEFELLKDSYINVLELAKSKNIRSIGIPLISSGTFSFPKKEAYKIAIKAINDFLIDNEMDVYLEVYDKESFSISKELSKDVKSYIEDNYIDKYSDRLLKSVRCLKSVSSIDGVNFDENETFKLDESFSEAVLRIIKEKGLYDPDVYKKVGIDRKLFSSLRNKKNYVPSKKTAIALCIGLELDIDSTNDLLRKAGFALSHSNLFDVIIEYFIINENYDLYDINSALLENDQELIGC